MSASGIHRGAAESQRPSSPACARRDRRIQPGLRPHPILSTTETAAVLILVTAVWLFIWLGSYSEWNYGIPTADNSTRCEEWWDPGDKGGCRVCAEGFINGGAKCFESLEEIPPVATGAFFGGTFYFVLIVCTQVCGIAVEVALIQKLRRRGLMPRKELLVLVVALLIEVVRMFLVDIVVLQDYFGGSTYQIFRVPLRCEGADAWRGANGEFYCNNPGVESYYIATHRQAFTDDAAKCSTFTADSPLLDYGPTSERFPMQFWPGAGHQRFSRLGWVLGGEFAFYYFFATFVNEMADTVFVIPTTTRYGQWCKVFAIALELFQLGALCPAAIFTHGSCLHYTNPLGVALDAIRGMIIWFGYCVAVIPFFTVPLAIVGLVIVGVLMCVSGVAFHLIARQVARGRNATESVDNFRERLQQRAQGCLRWYTESMGGLAMAVMMLAFFPLLISGMFLGSLVVVGQASKPGGMAVMTAIVLLSDVLFKIVATAVTEIADYAFHLRLRRAIARSTAGAHRAPSAPEHPSEPAAHASP